MSYSLLIAEDQSLIRDSLKTLLSLYADMHVCAVAADGAEACDLCKKHKPDIALLDYRMPKLNGLEAAIEIRKSAPQTKIVLLTTFEEDQMISEALRLNLEGIFLKDVDPDLFVQSLRIIANGFYVRHPAAGHSVSMPAAEKTASAVIYPNAFGLTDRDMELIRCIAEGLSNKLIAVRLACSEGTVKNRISTILGKMNLEDRTQVAVYAIRNGLIEDLD